MTGNDLLLELQNAPAKERKVCVCINIHGSTYSITDVESIETGRENDNIYIVINGEDQE